jgi:hypothetical protein
MKTITFVSVASLLIVSATMTVLQSPEKIPAAVWKEVPDLPGGELTEQEVLELNRIYGNAPLKMESRTTNRLTTAAGPPMPVAAR